MSSEQNNSTSFPPTEPKLCDNGCGFFGSPSNMNLCSKCYRSLRAEEDQTAVAKAAVKNSLKLPSCSLIITPEQKQPLETKPASVVVTAEPSSVPIATGQEEAEPSKPARTNRCFSCNKKVGVMGFKCRCGSTFCGSHRYPEKHECSFDFKEVGRDAIAKIKRDYYKPHPMIDFEKNINHPSSSSSDLLLAINGTTVNNKRKRRPAGTPDPDAEVVSLSPRTLLESDRYVCEICNQGFQRDQNLQMHRRRHKVPWKLLKREKKDEEVRKRVYVCPEPTCLHHNPCHALGDLVGIKKHFRRKHSAHKQWVCDRCSKGYAVQSDYKAHLKTCGSRGHSCDCGRVFSRVESFIEHQDTCTIRRPQPTNPPRPLQQNTSCHATPSITLSTTSIGPLLHGLPMLRPPQASHQQALASAYPLNASSSSYESLQLQLSIGMAKTSSNLKRSEKGEMSLALERANEEARRADEMRQEAKRQVEMAEMDFERAKNIREDAKAELEKAQFVREEAMKRIKATILEITCRSCKQLFQLPVMADESKTSLVMSYVSSARTEGEFE